LELFEKKLLVKTILPEIPENTVQESNSQQHESNCTVEESSMKLEDHTMQVRVVRIKSAIFLKICEKQEDVCEQLKKFNGVGNNVAEECKKNVEGSTIHKKSSSPKREELSTGIKESIWPFLLKRSERT